LNACVAGDYVSHAGCDQQQRIAVIVAAHQRYGFPLKATYLAVRQDGFETIADFNARPVIADGVENQNPAIGGLLPDAPLFKQIDGKSLDVGTIQSIDSNDCDLGVRFLVDLLTDLFHLRVGVGVQDLCEVVDVAGRLGEFGNLFSGGKNAERQDQDGR
jgi:hypothetical protein